HHRILPQPVQAARHQVVHEVVAIRDLMEHLVDEGLLLAAGDLAEAEARRHFRAARPSPVAVHAGRHEALHAPVIVLVEAWLTAFWRRGHGRLLPPSAACERADAHPCGGAVTGALTEATS